MHSNFKRDDPNIIHIHGTWSLITFLSCVYGYLCNIPYVIHPHGMLSKWSFDHKYIKKNIALSSTSRYKEIFNSFKLESDLEIPIEEMTWPPYKEVALTT